jgi:predicted GNAT family acetyltransferase
MSLGSGVILWQVDGTAVAYGVVGLPLHGMSRVGPVYTPPEWRGRGYGSAVTAACTRWALAAGARDVVLFTDLGNPVSNSTYQRMGYRPMFDTAELLFDR